MKIPKLTYNPKTTAILIILTYLIALLIGIYVERFRFSNYRWVYVYGSYLKLILIFGSLTWSFFHPLIIWSERKLDWKTTWKKQLIWIVVGLVPLLYFTIMMFYILLYLP